MNQVPAGALTIVFFLEVGLLALWFAVGVGLQRRSNFWARISLASFALPILLAALIGIARLNVLSDGIAKAFLPFLFFLVVMALLFVPVLLYRSPDSSSDPPDSDNGDGPGGWQPPPSPGGPPGGIPLPDAYQSSARTRDHDKPRFEDARRRRPAHKPYRRPARTNR